MSEMSISSFAANRLAPGVDGTLDLLPTVILSETFFVGEVKRVGLEDSFGLLGSGGVSFSSSK